MNGSCTPKSFWQFPNCGIFCNFQISIHFFLPLLCLSPLDIAPTVDVLIALKCIPQNYWLIWHCMHTRHLFISHIFSGEHLATILKKNGALWLWGFLVNSQFVNLLESSCVLPKSASLKSQGLKVHLSVLSLFHLSIFYLLFPFIRAIQPWRMGSCYTQTDTHA